MDRPNNMVTGALRRNALAYLTKAEKQKYEIAKELGLLEKVINVGWAGLSAKETGKIGGLMSRKKHTSKGD